MIAHNSKFFLIFGLGFALSACAPAGDGGGDAVVASTEENASRAPAAQAGAPSGLGRYLAGRFALNTGDFPLASTFLAQALEADAENVALLGQAMLADIGAGRVARATELAQRLLDADGDSPIARLLLGADALKAGETVVAERHFDALGADGVMSILQPLAIGWARAGAGAGEAALAALKPLEERRGAGGLATVQAGLMQAVAGDDAGAAARFAPLFDGDDERPPLRFAQVIAAFFDSRGDSAAVEAVKAAYLAGAPDSLAFDGVEIAAMHPVANAVDGLAEAVFALASVLGQEQAADLATLYTQIALHLRPDHGAARMLLAGLHERGERPESAGEIYASEPKGSPFYWTAQLRLAETLEARERIDDAVAALEALADIRPERFDALSQMGDTLRSADRFEDAA
ncbi:MAG: hypothetical protein AAF684_07490, partial [Pseudomonadota bacterium]